MTQNPSPHSPLLKRFLPFTFWPMPELPEVETTRRGIEPHLLGNFVREVIVRRRDLRQTIPPSIEEIESRTIHQVTRRAKYLIIHFVGHHHLIIHLGMSGSLRIVDPATEFRTHDHVAFTLSTGKQLRYHDPRRFGIVTHFVAEDPLTHPLFKNLGPEPLEEEFNARYLQAVLKPLKRPIKLCLMDNAVVVGVGNIYASESLFMAGIRPTTAAYKIALPRLRMLVACIQGVLRRSIEQGGTTLRDFLRENGEPGYFRQELFVYEREGQPCRRCNTPIKKIIQGQRSTYFCPTCQKR
jgi:formamidopyrimidine-DNA glycosylase